MKYRILKWVLTFLKSNVDGEMLSYREFDIHTLRRASLDEGKDIFK